MLGKSNKHRSRTERSTMLSHAPEESPSYLKSTPYGRPFRIGRPAVTGQCGSFVGI